MRHLVKNMGFSAFFTFINAFYPLLIIPHLTITLNPDSYGSVLYLEAIVKYLSTLAMLGLPIYGVKLIANGKFSGNYLHSFSELFSINLIFTFLTIFFIGIFFSTSFLEINFLTFCYLVILLFSSSLSLDWVLQGLEQFKFIAIRGFIVRVLTLILILIIIREPSDYSKYLLIVSASSLIIMITNWHYLYGKGMLPFHFHLEFIWFSFVKHIKPLSSLFLTIGAISVYTLLDTIFLGFFSTDAEVAFYNVGQKIPKAGSMLLASVITVLYPRQAATVDNETIKYQKLLDLSFETTLVLGGIIVISILVAGGLFLDLLVPIVEYDKTQYILAILSFTPLVIGLSNFFGIQVINIHGKNNILLLIISLGAFVSILLNILLIPLFNSIGSAITNLVTEILITIGMAIYSVKWLNVKIPWKLAGDVIIKLFLFALCLFIFRSFISGVSHSFLRLIILSILILFGSIIIFYNNIKKLFGNDV